MNVLIVGLGSIAKKHISALYEIKNNIKIYALRSSLNSKKYQNVKNIYNLIDIEINFDFVIISNPTSLHYKFIELFTKKNVPLFIEKPALNSLKNVKFLVDQINKRNLFTYIGFNLRFHPCIKFLKSFLLKKSKKINEVNVYSGSFLPEWRPDKDYKKSYSSDPKMGGGVHLDLIHELDYVIWLFGLPNKSISKFRNVSNLEIKSYDYANYSLDYDKFTANIILNYYRKSPKRELEIVFENKCLVVDLINNNIKNHNNEILFEIDNFNISKTYKLQLEYFIKCLIENKNPMNTFEESLKTLSICLNHEI